MDPIQSGAVNINQFVELGYFENSLEANGANETLKYPGGDPNLSILDQEQ